MQITKGFLEAEIRDLNAEMRKAEAFLIKAQGTIEAYSMLIQRLDAPEPEETPSMTLDELTDAIQASNQQ